MSALYIMHYLGRTGIGSGTLYIGKGQIVGTDVGNVRYEGRYEEANGRLVGSIALKSVGDGIRLVTGEVIPTGQSVPIRVDVPLDFANGDAHAIDVGGLKVHVNFEKIGDIL